MTIKANNFEECDAGERAARIAGVKVCVPGRAVSVFCTDRTIWCLTLDGRLFYAGITDLIVDRFDAPVWNEAKTPTHQLARERKMLEDAAWDEAILKMRDDARQIRSELYRGEG